MAQEKYQDSLDLFRSCYFKNGALIPEDYTFRGTSDSDRYRSEGLDWKHDRMSKITGRSMFTPRVLRKNVDGNDRYFLTLDIQGRFDHHFDYFYQSNKDNIKEIDITEMKEEEVMQHVRGILNMSNEEVMKAFNIKRTYRPKVKLALIIDDVITDYLVEQGLDDQITWRDGNPEAGINTNAAGLKIANKFRGYDEYEECSIKILYSSEEAEKRMVDRYYYKLNNPKEEDIEKMRVDIDLSEGEPETELGRRILSMLQERFTDRVVEGEQKGEEEPQIDLSNCSSEELIQRLADIRQGNGQKEEEFKALLIEQIKAAMQRGVDLDKLIEEAKRQLGIGEK